MYRLNLPPYEIKIKEKGGRHAVFDVLRRKYVNLTPEEWVRQHFIHYLTEHKGYPTSLLANEVKLRLGQKSLRCDSVLYDNMLQPRMIIEYKAPTIQITQKTFNQIFAYNILMHVDYLVVSNGMSHYCCRMDYEGGKYTFLNDIPDYKQL
ncbi:type I restriction enzyme HsdR N-terminal domain-containing protein [Prevotella sp. PCHR]|uniref:Type I restriction enzyme HsdR N-terminal domain-containing protein n=1 Tax=Xylanibacter caecicola TaxID=2736294 RepID=A0ABX2B3E8_9BACT|nr:type I restriction enzyme HsdR N-terminal domain-containing protein [Xylanibacter caecicola]NPE25776.1 type I restriction enzyme HsdR N-terminal domain-containing protein [Xylanibacter caecicola]